MNGIKQFGRLTIFVAEPLIEIAYLITAWVEVWAQLREGKMPPNFSQATPDRSSLPRAAKIPAGGSSPK
jgi:hypothetical protein